MTDREIWIALRDEVIHRVHGRLYGRSTEVALLVLAEMERLLPFGELVKGQA